MNEIELAWAAGLFDGEGSTTLAKRSGKIKDQYLYLQVSVRQNDRRVLDRFRDAVEVGKVYGPYERRGSTANLSTKDFYDYKASGKNALVVIERIRPYLSEEKLEQIAAVELRTQEKTCNSLTN